jgi:hypothetical protein
MGATSTDRGHPTVRTCDLAEAECQRLLDRALAGTSTPDEAEAFRGQLLTEMARMSLDDDLVMQIHPGSFRNHNPVIFRDFGRDKGADMPTRTDYVRALKPLLDRFGNVRGLTVILFMLDETTLSRERAPLAGHYPILKLDPPPWFFDSPEGMLRFRELTTETAGFRNTVGFNDDTRAFLSIPARHDVARRMDCRYLASLVVEHKIGEDEAFELAPGARLWAREARVPALSDALARSTSPNASHAGILPLMAGTRHCPPQDTRRSCRGCAPHADGELEIAGEITRRLRKVGTAIVCRKNPGFELTGLRFDDGRVVGDERLPRLG